MFDGHYDSPLANFLQEKFPSILSTELSKEDYPPKAFKRYNKKEKEPLNFEINIKNNN